MGWCEIMRLLCVATVSIPRESHEPHLCHAARRSSNSFVSSVRCLPLVPIAAMICDDTGCNGGDKEGEKRRPDCQERVDVRHGVCVLCVLWVYVCMCVC